MASVAEGQKQLVGMKVVDAIEDGSVVGLGTGSTVSYTIQELGRRVQARELNARVVVTSRDTEEKALNLGLEILNINEVDKVDIAIDGADEVSKELDLIKGGGGALTREKIIDYLADKFIVIVDERKLKEMLGTFPIPVEVLPFSWFQTKRGLEALGASVSHRMLTQQKPFVTDNGNYILDAKFTHIIKPSRLEQLINNIPGVIENGIFRHDKVTEVWVGTQKGVKVLRR